MHDKCETYHGLKQWTILLENADFYLRRKGAFPIECLWVGVGGVGWVGVEWGGLRCVGVGGYGVSFMNSSERWYREISRVYYNTMVHTERQWHKRDDRGSWRHVRWDLAKYRFHVAFIHVSLRILLKIWKDPTVLCTQLQKDPSTKW